MHKRDSGIAAPNAIVPEKGNRLVTSEIPARADELAMKIIDALCLTVELLPVHRDAQDRTVLFPLKCRLVGGVAILRIREAGDDALVVAAARLAAAGANIETRVIAEGTEEAVLDAVA